MTIRKAKWIQAYGQNYEQGFAATATGIRNIPCRCQRQGRTRRASVFRIRSHAASREHSLVLHAAIRFHDGRSRSLKLLHELPDPMTTITYGEWASIPQETADELRLQDGDELEITSGEWTRLLPVKLQPRLPAGVLMVEQALAAEPAVRVSGVTGAAESWIPDVKLRKTGKAVKLRSCPESPSRMAEASFPNPCIWTASTTTRR